MPTLVLFDLDDVFNAPFPHAERTVVDFAGHTLPESRYVNSEIDQVEVRIPPDWVTDRIVALEHVPGVECVWATTWEHLAGPLYGTAAGFGAEWRHVPFSTFDPPVPRDRWRDGLTVWEWKIAGIDLWLEQTGQTGVRVVFADDQVPRNQRFENASESLTVQVKARTGIRERDFDAIDRFVQETGVNP